MFTESFDESMYDLFISYYVNILLIERLKYIKMGKYLTAILLTEVCK